MAVDPCKWGHGSGIPLHCLSGVRPALPAAPGGLRRFPAPVEHHPLGGIAHGLQVRPGLQVTGSIHTLGTFPL